MEIGQNGNWMWRNQEVPFTLPIMTFISGPRNVRPSALSTTWAVHCSPVQSQKALANTKNLYYILHLCNLFTGIFLSVSHNSVRHQIMTSSVQRCCYCTVRKKGAISPWPSLFLSLSLSVSLYLSLSLSLACCFFFLSFGCHLLKKKRK
jgi:hypothetical protein